jgi:hypothetical protein
MSVGPHGPSSSVGWGLMQSIALANIDRFERLLKTESDYAKRSMILQLLAEERQKLGARAAGLAKQPFAAALRSS